MKGFWNQEELEMIADLFIRWNQPIILAVMWRWPQSCVCVCVCVCVCA